MDIQFLNLDLDVESQRNPKGLVDAFGDDVINLYCGDARSHQLAAFEVGGTIRDADSVIDYFCTLVESLDGEAKELWDTAFNKAFDIAIAFGS